MLEDRKQQPKNSKINSQADELAWTIARYFDEPYQQWRNWINKSPLQQDRIRSLFLDNQDGYYTKKDQARILMHKMLGS